MLIKKLTIKYQMNGVENLGNDFEKVEKQKTMADYLPSVSNQKERDGAKEEEKKYKKLLEKTGKLLDEDISEGLKKCDKLEGPEVNICIQETQKKINDFVKENNLTTNPEKVDKLGPDGRRKKIQNSLLDQAGLRGGETSPGDGGNEPGNEPRDEPGDGGNEI